MKRKVNNCTSIVKYKLTNLFTKKMQKTNIVCSILNNWHSLISTWKNDIFSIKIILNTLSCHMCIINFTLQSHNNYSIVFFLVGAHNIIQKDYIDYAITNQVSKDGIFLFNTCCESIHVWNEGEMESSISQLKRTPCLISTVRLLDWTKISKEVY